MYCNVYSTAGSYLVGAVRWCSVIDAIIFTHGLDSVSTTDNIQQTRGSHYTNATNGNIQYINHELMWQSCPKSGVDQTRYKT